MTKKVTKQNTSNEYINRSIRAVGTSAGRFNSLVQNTILAIIIHGNEYGDVTGAARLMDVMPKSAKRNLVQQQFQRYSPIAVYMPKGKKHFIAKQRNKENKAYTNYDIDGARANMWYDCYPRTGIYGFPC